MIEGYYLTLLGNAGFLTENSKNLTEFNKISEKEKGLNQADFGKLMVRSPGFEPGIISLEG